QLAPAALADRGEAPVGRDLVEPRPDETALVEAADAAPRAHERLLHRVLGVVQRAEHPVAVRLQLATVRRDQLLEGAGVAGARGVEQRGERGHGSILPVAMNLCAGPGSTSENVREEEPT